MEAERLERDFKKHHVALPADLGLCPPDGIPRIIPASVLGVEPVLLDAARVGEEHVGMAMVVEGVQKEADLVVVVDQLAAQHVGTHETRLRVEGEKDRIKALVGITEVSFRALAASSAVFGL